MRAIFLTLWAITALLHAPAGAQSTGSASGGGNSPSTGESFGTSAYGGAPWGMQVAPHTMPLLPRKPPIQATPAYRSDLSSAVSASGWSPERPATSALGQPAPGSMVAAPSDAVYLDSLTPASPPVIQPATLADQTIPAPSDLSQVQPTPQSPLPPGARDGVFQKAYFTGTYLPALSGGPSALGVTTLETGVVLGFPFFRRDTPLLVTPFFDAHLLDNSAPFDINSALYDAAIEFRHLRKFGDGPWAMDASATVGYYSDFQQSSSDAVRVSGRGIAVFETSPQLKWLAGVAYVNRAGSPIFPIGGAIWEPRPDLRIEAIFPKPKVLWQLAGGTTDDQRWIYVGGEFGGGVWSITRPSTGELDLLSYSDWRLLAGYERRIIGGLNRRFEIGYVFNRELDYRSATPDVTLDDTLFGRVGLTY